MRDNYHFFTLEEQEDRNNELKVEVYKEAQRKLKNQ
jgi:hypothetical protein